MSITLIATAGATNANAYCTLAEFNTYWDSKVNVSSSIINALPATKNSAIVWATRLLDERVSWAGVKTAESQALRWPRIGVSDRDGYVISQSIIPTWLKNATAELSGYLILSDRTDDPDGAGIRRLRADVIEIEFDKNDRTETIPSSVWTMISYYATRAAGIPRSLRRVGAGGGSGSAYDAAIYRDLYGDYS